MHSPDRIQGLARIPAMPFSTVSLPVSDSSIRNTHILHLTVVGQPPVAEGPHGCDYAWNDDFTAYRCLRHRWNPLSDASYVAHVGGADTEADDGLADDEIPF